jgi:hypothetical protein
MGIRNLAEELRSVGKLGLKLVPHLLSNGVAALPDSWSDRSDEVLRPGVELNPHASHAVFHNPRHSAPPSGMKSGNRPLLPISNKNRNAIGSLDAEEHSGLVGH